MTKYKKQYKRLSDHRWRQIEAVEVALAQIDDQEWASFTGKAPCDCVGKIRKALEQEQSK